MHVAIESYNVCEAPLEENHVIAEPIYLLDFRNGQVVELDPTADGVIEDTIDEPETGEPPRPGITFAAFGSPIERKD